MATLAAALQARGFSLRTFASAAEFIAALPLVESLSFDEGLTFNPVTPQEILVAADELVSLVEAASRT